MVIAETILSAFLQALLKSLMAPLFEKLYREWRRDREHVKDIIGRLKTTLVTISAVLIDAEEKQITNQAVQHWVNELKDAVYHAEDVLDDITAQATLPKGNANFKKGIDTKKVDKLTKVMQTLENLASQKNGLSLEEGKTGRHIRRLMTTSLIGEETVIGRQPDKEKIREFLMTNNEDNILKSVVAIVGIGGVGKTTVAQLLYNEQCITERFKVKAWIHVSVEEDDVFSLTKTIYESINGNPCAFTSLDLLHVNLKEMLEDKTFLLVLDDMWSVTFNHWQRLCQPFASAVKGSQIIVTTRSHHVAKIVCPSYTHTHTLQPLSFQECFRLIEEQPHGAKEQDLNREFRSLARDVVKKCQGLPLAAKEFGGLLWSNREVGYWKRILSSKIWTAPTKSTEIFSDLRVSYDYLPSHLKRCFAYCSIFPKGYAFDKERVVLLWMSEGLLQKDAITYERMEDVGDEYFSELVSRSLFQQMSDTKFIMNDLINELAQFAAGEFCFKYENQTLQEISEIQGITGRTRHLSYLRDQYSGEANKFEEVGDAKFLRTFLPLSLEDLSPSCSLSNFVRDRLIMNLTCLRVLSLSHYSIATLPSYIFKNMRHVRYLDLSRTNLKRLPTSVRFLYNLQTLLLSFCPNLIELEEAICDLVRLEYLDLTASTRLTQMPHKFGRLIRLHTLTTFVVGAGKGVTISELRDLTKLSGKLTILELHRVGDIRDAEQANLESKTHLKEIDFTWRTESLITDDVSVTHNEVDVSVTQNEIEIFEKLSPPSQIEKLTIRRYYGDSFPTWMSDPSFSSIVQLSLTECKKCTSLPYLGRLSGLKELHISKMRAVTSIGSEFYTSHPESLDQDQQPFRSLETLTFEDMPNWKEWVDVKVYGGTLFRKLHELFIVKCPQLASELPGFFPSLVSLKIYHSESLIFNQDSEKFPKLEPLN